MNPTLETARDTKDKILDAAEQLFAQHGFASTSLRRITRAAGVNLAAVNYHFQSKELLIEAILRRKIGPINTRRLALLDYLESNLPEQPPSLVEVVAAFFMPVFEAQTLGVNLGDFPKLMGRVYTDPSPWARRLMEDAFSPIVERFAAALLRAGPALRNVDVAWGLHLSIGAMAHYLAAGDLLGMISRGQVDPGDMMQARERLIRFASAGILAMAVQEQPS